MSDALAGLIALLDLEPLEVNLFRGVSPDEDRQRVFGGQVAGQALVAATRTVDSERVHVHSLHAYFLRPGDPTVPILYQVDRTRDGKSFTTRHVEAIQHGRPIFSMTASFHMDEPGLSYQSPFPEGVPAAESLPTFRERMAPYADKMGAWYHRPRPIDMRHVGANPHEWSAPEAREPRSQVWLRADGTLPDDQLLHACVLTYASDMTLIDTALRPHGLGWNTDTFVASLDHAMWFHRPFRADDWLLYDQDTPASHRGLGFARGQIFSADGTLVVSVAQEGLIRMGR